MDSGFRQNDGNFFFRDSGLRRNDDPLIQNKNGAEAPFLKFIVQKNALCGMKDEAHVAQRPRHAYW
jgi:hypothetical protein